MFTACNQKEKFTVTGEIEGVKGEVYLAKVVGRNVENIDTTKIEGGKFVFKGSVEEPDQYVILFKENPPARVSLFLENSVINIKGDLKNPQEAPKITGSATQDVVDKYMEAMKPFQERDVAIRKEGAALNQTKDEEGLKELRKKFDDLQEEVKVAVKNFIRSNNKSVVAAIIVASQRLNTIEDIKAHVELLDPSVRKHKSLENFNKVLDNGKNVEIGKVAPDFTLKDMDDNEISLSSYLGKGYVLVDFWASWCGPCRKENPVIVKAYNEFKDKGFEIIGVSLDRSNATGWKKAVKDDGLTWPQVIDWTDNKAIAAEKYAILTIPANFLLDKEGKIIAKGLRGEELKEKLSELLK